MPDKKTEEYRVRLRLGGDDQPEWKESDRDRGILTTHDRKYLLDEIELEGQDERNARYRIRQRTLQAIYDMKLIAEKAEREDLSQVSEEAGGIANIAPINLAYRLIRANNEISDTLEAFEEYVAKAAVEGQEPIIRESGTSGVFEIDGSAEIEIDHEETSFDSALDSRDLSWISDEVIESLREEFEKAEMTNATIFDFEDPAETPSENTEREED